MKLYHFKDRSSNLIYIKTKELGWRENQCIQNIVIEDSSGNIVVDGRRVQNIWENYITELYDQANRQENLEVKTEEKVDEDEKGPYILRSKVEKAIKEMKDKKATLGIVVHLGMYSHCWEKRVSK